MVHNDYISSAEPLLEVDAAELVWAKITLIGHKDLLLGSYYRPPSSDLEYLDKLNSSLSSASIGNSNIWLAGDFNVPHIEWESESISPQCQNRTIHNRLLDITSSNSLTQVVNKSTRGENTLDLFFTNNPSLINRVETMPGMSDHDIVYVESEITPNRVVIPKRKIYLFNKCDYEPLKRELLNFQAEFDALSDKNTTELWNVFKSKL